MVVDALVLEWNEALARVQIYVALKLLAGVEPRPLMWKLFLYGSDELSADALSLIFRQYHKFAYV